jgi:hypothetical protein
MFIVFCGGVCAQDGKARYEFQKHFHDTKQNAVINQLSYFSVTEQFANCFSYFSQGI